MARSLPNIRAAPTVLCAPSRTARPSPPQPGASETRPRACHPLETLSMAGCPLPAFPLASVKPGPQPQQVSHRQGTPGPLRCFGLPPSVTPSRTPPPKKGLLTTWRAPHRPAPCPPLARPPARSAGGQEGIGLPWSGGARRGRPRRPGHGLLAEGLGLAGAEAAQRRPGAPSDVTQLWAPWPHRLQQD